MTMTATGAIRLSEVNVEAGHAAGTTINMRSGKCSFLAQRSLGGSVSMSHLYSKFAYSISAGADPGVAVGFATLEYGTVSPTTWKGADVTVALDSTSNNTFRFATFPNGSAATMVAGAWINNTTLSANAMTFASGQFTWTPQVGLVNGTSYKLIVW